MVLYHRCYGRRSRRSLRLAPSRGAQPQQLRLVDDLHAELLRLVQLGTGFRAGDDVIDFLADAAADFAARCLDLRRGLLALEARQRAGQDEGLAGQRTRLGSWLVEDRKSTRLNSSHL